jgi:HEAT repeat protein
VKVWPGLVFALALASASPAPARAFVWPDVAERVERDLAAADPGTRRSAARELSALGATRGAPLALQALSDTDAEVRLAAADAAIHLRAAGATETAVAWLNAPDPRLRRKACEVARALPHPRAVAPLARTLGDPDPDVRGAAAEALGHQASGDAVPPLLGRLDDPAPAVRIQIVAALARLGDVRAVVPLVGKVQDSSPEVREAVARALGDLGDPRASSALVLALRDPNGDVRRDALGALGRMRASDAVDAIAPFVQDRAPALRLAAIAALGRIASADAVRALVSALGTADDAGASVERTPVRDALVAAGAAALPSLHAVLDRSPSPTAAASAAWVLGEMRAHNEAGAIVAAMRRGALPTASALHALAGAGTAAEVPVVLEFVADPSPLVRAEALGAAAALLDPNRPDGRAVEPLAAALRDARPSAPERARIAALLGRTGAPRAAPLLVEIVKTHDPALRLAAIDALGLLGQDRATADPSGARAPKDQPRFGAGAPKDKPDAGPDGALLEALGSPDATVRLHAAIALSEAGGARARDALLAQLDGGDEVDRAAVLTALGGVLARAPTETAVAKLAEALDLAAGPERDAILEALGRAPLASAVRGLSAAAASAEPSDRRVVASLLAAHAGDPGTRGAALALARGLLADGDATVRAQAAWSLGTLGDPSDLPRLEAVTRSGGAAGAPTQAAAPAAAVDAASDAAAAIGRIAARSRAPEAAARSLCPLLSSPRPYVRANALAGVALAGARCADGAPERALLADDPSDEARAAAALALSRAPTAADARALERCARADPSGLVAARCRAAAAAPSRTHATLVFVYPEGAATPRPGSAYAMLLADGTLHAGTTDRRGAVFDPVAPEGELTLRRPSALAK